MSGRAPVDGVPHDRTELDARAANLDLVAGEPRCIEQVVDEAHELLELAFQHRQGTAVIVPADLEQAQSVAHGRERVPQLVGQRRQELALAPVRFAELGLQTDGEQHPSALAGQPVGEAELLLGPRSRAGRVGDERSGNPVAQGDRCAQHRSCGRRGRQQVRANGEVVDRRRATLRRDDGRERVAAHQIRVERIGRRARECSANGTARRLLEHGQGRDSPSKQIETGPCDVIERDALGGGEARHVEQGLEQPLAALQRLVEGADLLGLRLELLVLRGELFPLLCKLSGLRRELCVLLRELVALRPQFLGLRPHVVQRGLETVAQRDNQMHNDRAGEDVDERRSEVRQQLLGREH